MMSKMAINHHLTDEILMGYAAGTLPEAFDLVVATHVSMCDECRARLDSFNAVGGSLLESEALCDVSDDSFAETLKLISKDPKDPIKTERRRVKSIFPQPLQHYAGDDPDAVRWRSLGMGVRQALLQTTGEATVRLLYIPGGVAMPDHGHRGTEMTLVLQGAFRDEVDRFGPGDVEVANEHFEHTPIAEEGEPCICLAATDAPLRFNALLPKIAQPFLKI